MPASSRGLRAVSRRADFAPSFSLPITAAVRRRKPRRFPELNAEWAGKGVRVIHGDAYYSDAAQIDHLMRQGESRAAIGQHASIIDTSELMAVNPRGVDLGRLAGLKLTRQPTGIVGDPARASAERGKELLEMRIRAVVQQLRSEMAKH